MASESQFLRAMMPSLPSEVANKLRSLCASSPATETMLENLIRFLVGGEAAPEASAGIKSQWVEKQASLKPVLSSLVPLRDASSDRKRSREDDDANNSESASQQLKKPRITAGQGDAAPIEPGARLSTLRALSTTSPIRKKVDITIHQNAVVMTNSSSNVVEATIPTSHLRRAFILPTRGKTKPHWTVVILSGDVPDVKNKTAGNATVSSENQQIIFGIDATSASNFVTTTYEGTTPVNSSQQKGSTTLPFVRQFLSHLSILIIEPAEQGVFKSACPGIMGNATSSSSSGIPGVEAYRGAKAGNLWFSKEGILWGESKPCEFWAVEDLLGPDTGVRMVGAGRTFTVVLTRRVKVEVEVEDGGDGAAEEEEMGEETEFGMVDAKEREGIQGWVRNHRHLFYNPTSASSKEEKGKGKAEETTSTSKTKAQNINTGPVTIHSMQDVSDDEDEDFDVDVSDLDGSERSSEESSSESENEEGDSEEDAEGEGEGEDEEQGQDGVEEEDEEEEDEMADEGEFPLDPAHHPLLRPGAMPKMSKAALQMAVGIVESAFVGETGDMEEDEEDELDE